MSELASLSSNIFELQFNIWFTNKEALTVSVLLQSMQEAARARKRCRRKHLTMSGVSSYFFRALAASCLLYNRTEYMQSRLLYLFYDKESVTFLEQECHQHTCILYSHKALSFFQPIRVCIISELCYNIN